MIKIDKKKMARDMAIARFAKFVKNYLYDTDWRLVATMCGISDVLNEHERVTKAQFFQDSDYGTAIIDFLQEIFNFDEQVGRALINEIVQQEELSEEAKK